MKLAVRYDAGDGGPPWVVYSGEIKVARLETESRALDVLRKLERLQARASDRMVLVRSIKSIKEDAMKKASYPLPKPPKAPKKGGGKAPKC